MRAVLFLNLEGVHYYGNIPDPSSLSCEQIKELPLEESDWPLLSKWFVDPINQLCGTALDYGDVDYFDSDSCRVLCQWLNGSLRTTTDHHLRAIYSALLDLGRTAVQLGTGIVLEF